MYKNNQRVIFNLIYLNVNNATTNLHSKKKRMETRIIKNIFNKNDSICRDVKTQKVCEQGRDG